MFRDLKRVPCFRGRSANEESLQDRRESMRVLQDQHAFARTYAGRWFCKSVAKAWHPAHDLSIRCLNRKRNGKQKLPKSRRLREFVWGDRSVHTPRSPCVGQITAAPPPARGRRGYTWVGRWRSCCDLP